MQFDIGLNTNTIHHLKNKKINQFKLFSFPTCKKFNNTTINNKPHCSFVVSSLAQYLVNLDEVHVQCVTSKELCLLELNIKDV
jgi:hypothetical protein